VPGYDDAGRLISVQPGDTIAVYLPGPGAGRIETSGSVDRYTFTATAGDRISVVDLTSGASCGDLLWDLLDTKGSLVYASQVLCKDAERPPIAATNSGKHKCCLCEELVRRSERTVRAS